MDLNINIVDSIQITEQGRSVCYLPSLTKYNDVYIQYSQSNISYNGDVLPFAVSVNDVANVSDNMYLEVPFLGDVDVVDQLELTEDIESFAEMGEVTVSDDIELSENYGEESVTDAYGSEDIQISEAVIMFMAEPDINIFTFDTVNLPDGAITPTLIDSFSEINANTDFVQMQHQGQSFVPAGNDVLNSSKFYLKNQGSATGTITSKLWSTVAGEPDTLLATSDSIDIATIPGADTLVTFTFSGANKVNLVAGTTYVITAHSEPTSSYVSIYGHDGLDMHSGTGFVQIGAPWLAMIPANIGTYVDVIFYVYGDGGAVISNVTVTEDLGDISTYDTINISETLGTDFIYFLDIFDNINIYENISFEWISDLSVIDNIEISENVESTVCNEVSVYDTLNLTELVNIEVPLLGGISKVDTINISDVVNPTLPQLGDIGTFDVINISEYVISQSPDLGSIGVFDTVLISENFAPSGESKVQVVDNISISDVVVVNNSQLGNIVVNDTISISEDLLIYSIFGVTVSDTVNISEYKNWESFRFEPTPGRSRPKASGKKMTIIGTSGKIDPIANIGRGSNERPIARGYGNKSPIAGKQDSF